MGAASSLLSLAIATAAVATLGVGCSQGGDGSDFTISGHVSSTPAMARKKGARAPLQRNVTHVMAVASSSAHAERTIVPVNSDGSFSLKVTPGQPYVVVFVDDTAVGADMVVAIYRNDTFHTIAPQAPGETDIGDVSMDPSAQTATASIDYNTLLTDLGLSAAGAEYLGSIDNLSLRYANPDIDADGVIDMLQNHYYGIDFDVRFSTLRGVGGPAMKISDMTDKFFDLTGDNAAIAQLALTSIYVEYPTSLDSTVYVDRNMSPATQVMNGGAYSAMEADGAPAMANSSFSGYMEPDTAKWGADYDEADNAQIELPGSSGTPATLAYTLGAINTTLTFDNVVTQTRAQLTGDGMLATFVKLDTTAGVITGVDYEWMKQSAGTWVLATDEEIALTVGEGGAVGSLNHMPLTDAQDMLTLPAQPSGHLAWTGSVLHPDDICGMAINFTDKLGMSHYTGGAIPNAGDAGYCHN